MESPQVRRRAHSCGHTGRRVGISSPQGEAARFVTRMAAGPPGGWARACALGGRHVPHDVPFGGTQRHAHPPPPPHGEGRVHPPEA